MNAGMIDGPRFVAVSSLSLTGAPIPNEFERRRNGHEEVFEVEVAKEEDPAEAREDLDELGQISVGPAPDFRCPARKSGVF